MRISSADAHLDLSKLFYFSKVRMKFALFILLLFLPGLYNVCVAQDNKPDCEQQQLELCYNYSKIFGCTVDTINQPELFQTIYDWLGVPYHYSGDSRNGIDCSGFVDMLFSKVYKVELAECSGDIYRSAKTVKKNKMEIGDLVFFKIRKKRVSHVGVYIGNNKFAHASVQEGVIISDLDETYYKKYFFKAGRVKMNAGENTALER